MHSPNHFAYILVNEQVEYIRLHSLRFYIDFIHIQFPRPSSNRLEPSPAIVAAILCISTPAVALVHLLWETEFA